MHVTHTHIQTIRNMRKHGIVDGISASMNCVVALFGQNFALICTEFNDLFLSPMIMIFMFDVGFEDCFVKSSTRDCIVRVWHILHSMSSKILHTHFVYNCEFPLQLSIHAMSLTVYPKKYAHGFVVLCFVVVMQSFIMNSHEVFIHIHQGCFAGTGEIVRLPQCQWSKPDGYGKISQCITTTKLSKAKTVYIFLGIYCKSLTRTLWN